MKNNELWKSGLFIITIFVFVSIAILAVSEKGSTSAIFRVYLFLFILLGIFYFLFNSKKFPLLKNLQQHKKSNIKVIDKLVLEPSASIYLLEIGTKKMLIAVGNKNVRSLCDLPEKFYEDNRGQ